MKTLPVDVYDTLELTALAFGGIGRSTFFEFVNHKATDTPNCIMGLCAHAENLDRTYGIYSEMRKILNSIGIYTYNNDKKVGEINIKKSVPIMSRVSWEEYCAEFEIVRGG